MSRDFPAAVRADRALSERKAKLLNMNYAFGPDKLHLREGSMDIPYKKFTKLVEYRQYLYLFESRNSVCMMDKESIKPADIMGFAAFLEKKNWLKWQAEKSSEHEHLRYPAGRSRHVRETIKIAACALGSVQGACRLSVVLYAPIHGIEEAARGIAPG